MDLMLCIGNNLRIQCWMGDCDHIGSREWSCGISNAIESLSLLVLKKLAEGMILHNCRIQMKRELAVVDAMEMAVCAHWMI